MGLRYRFTITGADTPCRRNGKWRLEGRGESYSKCSGGTEWGRGLSEDGGLVSRRARRLLGLTWAVPVGAKSEF